MEILAPIPTRTTKDNEQLTRAQHRHITVAVSVLANHTTNRFNPLQAPLGVRRECEIRDPICDYFFYFQVVGVLEKTF